MLFLPFRYVCPPPPPPPFQLSKTMRRACEYIDRCSNVNLINFFQNRSFTMLHEVKYTHLKESMIGSNKNHVYILRVPTPTSFFFINEHIFEKLHYLQMTEVIKI